MKAAFGLVALLLSVGIILFLLAGPLGKGGRSYLQTVTDVKKEKEPQVQQWGGKDVKGRALYDTIELAPWPETGRMRGAVVDTIDTTGPAATFYGLQTGDVIVQIQSQQVGGSIISDEEAAEAFLTDAFARSAPIVVEREGQELILPAQQTGSPGPTPSAGDPGATDSGTGSDTQTGPGGIKLPPGIPGR